MSSFLQNIFGANWKTSLMGFLEGSAIAVIGVAVGGTFTWPLTGVAVLRFISGLLQKDYDSTGIGDKATKNPAKDATVPTNLAGV